MKITTHISLVGAMLAAFALPISAQTDAAVSSAPGRVSAAQTVTATATITAIDSKTREITLKAANGKETTLTAGPAVKNFAKLKVGDQVTIDYIEGLTLELKKGGGQAVAKTEQAGAVAAKPGAKPAGAVGRKVTVVADVIAVDAATQTVTLKGPQRTIDLPVRDPEQFKRIAKGDQVEATYTEALAVKVEPAAKK